MLVNKYLEKQVQTSYNVNEIYAKRGEVMALNDNIQYLKGVGPKRAELLKKLDIETVGDLIYHLPRNYLDLTSPVAIADAVLDETNVIFGRVVSKLAPARIRKGMTIYRLVFTEGVDDMSVVIYNSEFMFKAFEVGCDYILCGKVTGNMTSREMSSPIVIKASANDKILPIYPLTEGINQNYLRTCIKKALEQLNNESFETLGEDDLRRICLMPLDEALKEIHFPKNKELAVKARRRLALDELLTLQLAMHEMRSNRRTQTGYKMQAHSIDAYYRALPFKLTGAQSRAIFECLSDMCQNAPMNRLVLGDVGSGKTAVAAACCYFAYLNGTQSVLMAPTEILAQQHYDTLCKFLLPLGVKVALLTGSLTAKNKRVLKEGIALGEYNVIVGTHALLQQSTEFNDLGLVITDEQHRFGVEQRAALEKKGKNPHRLVMSATPIPRTLALMIYGELDISLLDELPGGRKKIETYAVTGKLRKRAFAFIKDRLNEGRQAYIVCPAIEENETVNIKSVKEYADKISAEDFKDFSVGLLHGQMPASKKDEVMRRFKNGEIDVLVSTTVIEVGVDVPNAAVMLVEDADRFGLSQLHQLRGRVGRGEYQSYCILVTDNVSDASKQRLRVLSSTSDGFKISEADLELRGPGDFFGSAQHGLPKLKIADIAADSDVLKLAQSVAGEINSRGLLDLPQYSKLKERVHRLFSGEITG